jgi:hypothetical protein
VGRVCVHDRGADGNDHERAGAPSEQASRGPELGVGHLRRRVRRELDHWLFINQHWSPATTRFWIPDGFFGGAGDALDLTAVGESVAGGEHLFVNTYLIGVTTFAAAGRSKYARYAAELAAVESEHRVLGQALAGASPPNDLGFAEFEFDRVSQIAAAAKSAGFGFGGQGTAAGRFYDLPPLPMVPRVRISSNHPSQAERDAT